MVCIWRTVIAQGKIFWQASGLGPWFLPVLVERISAASGPVVSLLTRLVTLVFSSGATVLGVCDLGSWPMQGNFCSLGPLAPLVTRLVMFVLSSGATPVCTSVPPTAASASAATPATSAPRRSWSRLLSSSLCRCLNRVVQSNNKLWKWLLVLWFDPAAVSTFSPRQFAVLKGLMMHVGVYLCIVWNELKCGYAIVVHTSSSFCPHTRTQFSYHLRTDRAKSGHCQCCLWWLIWMGRVVLMETVMCAVWGFLCVHLTSPPPPNPHPRRPFFFFFWLLTFFFHFHQNVCSLEQFSVPNKN